MEPLRLGPLFGGYGAAPAQLSALFTNDSADESVSPFPIGRRRVTRDARSVRLSDIVRNSRHADIAVDPRTAAVTMDGERLHFEPVRQAPL